MGRATAGTTVPGRGEYGARIASVKDMPCSIWETESQWEQSASIHM